MVKKIIKPVVKITRDKPGQPVSYTPELLEDKFIAYLTECIANTKLANIVGFSLYAKIDDQTYYNYKKQDEYLGSIKRIEASLEDFSIQSAYTVKNPAFLIFYMKNKFGYKDKTEVETIIKDNIKEKTREELETELKALESTINK